MVALVLLPGMDGTGELFADFVARLGPDIDAIVVRYPTRGALGYAELERIARASLPTDRPFLVLAESFSGPIGVALAAQSPPGLLGLVLCCSFVANPRPGLKTFAPLVGLVPSGRTAATLVGPMVLGRFATAERMRALRSVLRRLEPEALRTRMRAMLEVDVAPALADIRVPVLYLRATEDRLVPEAAPLLLQRHLPGARVMEIEAPHFLLQVAPAAAAREVDHFIEALVRGD